MHDPDLKESVRALRALGHSYSFISRRFGVPKSTLSDWLGSMPYQPNEATLENIASARKTSALKMSHRKLASLQEAKRQARQDVGDVTARDLLMFGLGVYLGEGNKTGDIVRIVNADAKVIMLSVAWFRSLGVELSQFAITMHLYPDSDPQKCLHYWSETTTIPQAQFRKYQVDKRTNKRKDKRGKLPYGTVQLSVRSGGRKEFGSFFSRKILASIDAVLENTRD